MQHWAVQALVVIQQNQLPVRLDLVFNSSVETQFPHAPVRELLSQTIQLLRKWPWVFTQVNEDVTVPEVAMDTIQRILFPPETLTHMWSADKASLQAVSPAMVRALNSARELAFVRGADAGSAVAAHVVKGVYVSAFVAGHDYAFVSNLSHEEITGRCDLPDATSANPGLAKKALQFILE